MSAVSSVAQFPVLPVTARFIAWQVLVQHSCRTGSLPKKDSETYLISVSPAIARKYESGFLKTLTAPTKRGAFSDELKAEFM